MLDNCKLKGIRYESSAGSMDHHSEFGLDAREDEVIRACYWSDYYFSMEEENAEPEKLAETDGDHRTSDEDKMTVREHIPMDKELWGALAEEIGYLQKQLRPVENREPAPLPDPNIQVLDGGDYQRFYLTWETSEGEQTVQYYTPGGRRWSSVIEIIHEMARPVGRNLRQIGETCLTEFFMKTPKYSYQITPIKNSEEYYFFVHGDKSPIGKVTREQWLPVREFLSGLDVSGYKPGKYESKYYLRLKYNDDMNRDLEADKKLCEQIKEFVRKNILGE